MYNVMKGFGIAVDMRKRKYSSRMRFLRVNEKMDDGCSSGIVIGGSRCLAAVPSSSVVVASASSSAASSEVWRFGDCFRLGEDANVADEGGDIASGRGEGSRSTSSDDGDDDEDDDDGGGGDSNGGG